MTPWLLFLASSFAWMGLNEIVSRTRLSPVAVSAAQMSGHFVVGAAGILILGETIERTTIVLGIANGLLVTVGMLAQTTVLQRYGHFLGAAPGAALKVSIMSFAWPVLHAGSFPTLWACGGLFIVVATLAFATRHPLHRAAILASAGLTALWAIGDLLVAASGHKEGINPFGIMLISSVVPTVAYVVRMCLASGAVSSTASVRHCALLAVFSGGVAALHVATLQTMPHPAYTVLAGLPLAGIVWLFGRLRPRSDVQEASAENPAYLLMLPVASVLGVVPEIIVLP